MRRSAIPDSAGVDSSPESLFRLLERHLRHMRQTLSPYISVFMLLALGGDDAPHIDADGSF